MRTVRGLARRGVETLFVQTGNHRQRAPLHRPAALGRLLAAAERAGMRTVAWYLPGLAAPWRDWQRVRTAVNHRSAAGHRFDGFALDIEATEVRDVALRNRRLLWLSQRLRRLVGEQAGLGAIIPDPVTQRFWPRFPYRRLRAHYDVFLPMAYRTFHSRGGVSVFRHTRDTLRVIRRRTADPTVPIHLIGGIANEASPAEVRSFARASVRFGATGASLYDSPITSPLQRGLLRQVRAPAWSGPQRSARSIQATRAPSQRLR